MATLGDVMTKRVFTIDPDGTVADAAAAMVRGRFGSAVVTHGTMLAGIFTERDVLRAAASGADLRAEKVSRWMTDDPVTGEPGGDCEDAAQTMLAQGFRHLPVVDGNDIVGIVSLRDLLSARLRR